MNLDEDYRQYIDSVEASKGAMTKSLETKAEEERLSRGGRHPMANIPEDHQKTLRDLDASRLADAMRAKAK